MLSYCLRPGQWSSQDFDFSSADSLVEAFIPPFLTQVGRAFRSGILQGYRTDDAALPGVRGRIRFDDQIRDRFGLFPPVEVRFDEFSEDIEVNRLIRAALCRLERLAVRYPLSRQKLRFFQRSLERVADVEYMPSALPEVVYNRLNEHYRPAVELAKLVLRWTTFDLGHGDVPATAFLVDMNRVFEDFVVVALRESLAVPADVFSQGTSGKRLFLDSPELIRLEPDMSWWEDDVCIFVGDVKYKRVNVAGIKHPDLYQLLAYAEAANLRTGLLVYAAGEGDSACHIVRHSGVKLHVGSLDLSGSPEEILEQVDQMANVVRSLRESNRGHLAVAWP